MPSLLARAAVGAVGGFGAGLVEQAEQRRKERLEQLRMRQQTELQERAHQFSMRQGDRNHTQALERDSIRHGQDMAQQDDAQAHASEMQSRKWARQDRESARAAAEAARASRDFRALLGGGSGPEVSEAEIAAIIHQESGGNPNAVSPKGARGLMQVMPATARDPGLGVPDIFTLAKSHGIEVADDSDATLNRLLDNPSLNQDFGTRYYSALRERYGGDRAKALAAYNAGPGAVDKYGGVPPYGETENYVQSIEGSLGAADGQGANPPATPPRNAPDGGGQIDIERVNAILSNPNAPEGVRVAARDMLKRHLDERDKSSDPPKVQTLTLDDGSQVAVQWDRGQRQWVPIDAPAGGGVAPVPGDMTEVERKFTLFTSMIEQTAPALQSLEQEFNPANIQDQAAQRAPIASSYFKSQEGQIYDASAGMWSEAALRIATGAAATAGEVARIRSTYFATVGDTPLTVAWKLELRNAFERAMRASLGKPTGEALPDPREFADRFAADRQRQAGGSAAPSAADRQGSNGGPPVGAEYKGYRFKGGNPNDPASWEKM